jgi:hypothetical protein
MIYYIKLFKIRKEGDENPQNQLIIAESQNPSFLGHSVWAVSFGRDF